MPHLKGHPYLRHNDQLDQPETMLRHIFAEIGGCDDALIQILLPLFSRMILHKGDQVYKFRDPSDALYLVEQGELQVFLPNDLEEPRTIETAIPGTLVRY